MDQNDDRYLDAERSAAVLALVAATCAGARGEVPVGAVLRDGYGRFLAQVGNRLIEDSNPLGHAEMLAIRAGGENVGNYRLNGADLWVSLEPCAMCQEAARTARMGKVQFLASGPQHDQRRFESADGHNARICADVCSPHYEDLRRASAAVLRFFFESRR